jgi:Nickel/cobalt transporter regulator
MRKLTIALMLATAVSAVPAYAQRGEWRGEGRRAERSESGDSGQRERGNRAGWGFQQQQAAEPQAQPQSQPQRQRQPQYEPRPDRGNSETRRQGWQGRNNDGAIAVPNVPQQPQADGRRWNGGGGNWDGQRRGERPQGRVTQTPNGNPGGFDRNGDGRVDRNWDRNRNGVVDRTWDRNRDGNLDRRWDRNNDERLDRHWDGNRDGRVDGRYDRNRDDRVDNRWGDRGHDGHNWNRGWRNDRRYDWSSYRNQYRHYYNQPRYYNPYGYGYGYRRYGIGIYLDSLFFSNRYWVNDPWQYRLPDPGYGYRWVRYYDDVLLVDVRSGYVVDVIHDFFF